MISPWGRESYSQIRPCAAYVASVSYRDETSGPRKSRWWWYPSRPRDGLTAHRRRACERNRRSPERAERTPACAPSLAVQLAPV